MSEKGHRWHSGWEANYGLTMQYYHSQSYTNTNVVVYFVSKCVTCNTNVLCLSYWVTVYVCCCVWCKLSQSNIFISFVCMYNIILYKFSSFWPSDPVRRQGTESTLAQVMACCLTTPSHYLNQCWLIISEVLWHSLEGIIMRRSKDTNQ